MDQPEPPMPSRRVRGLVLAATLVIGVLWVTVKHPYEGRVIYELSERHGIHRYDVVGFIPALIALVWWLGTPVD